MLRILHLLLLLSLCTFIAGTLSSCVYKVDVQQGNLLEDKDIDEVKIGMTRSQVRFLLGTPVVQNLFQEDRWDYIYYFRQGRRENADRAWLVIMFDDNIVREIRRDVPTKPS